MAEAQQYHSEMIDLPSEGRIYSKESALSSGKIEIKYMTAKEEDILTSQNLIKKGVVIDRLLDSLILTKGVKSADLILGDKNAVMVAARVLAYGPEYTVDINNPNTNEKIQYNFNLADCPFKKLPEDIDSNDFEIELPVSKQTIKFKLLTGKEEAKIEEELIRLTKLGSQVSPELTTRLRHTITAVDGDSSAVVINKFVEGMLSRDSLALRNKIQEISPDIELKQEIEMGGEMVEVDIPLTIEFFWPSSIA